MNRPKVKYHPLGSVDYKEAWDYQESLFNALISSKQQGASDALSHLITCEHPHVFTLGKSGKKDHLLADEASLSEIDAKFYQINRGGDITYHGPGQLVVYPILDLEQFFTDIHKYLRFLEEVIILTIAEYGIKGTRSDGETGVWLDAGTPFARKICAMGIRSSRWVTMHGFALNANVNLGYFDNIIPCGIRGKAVASMETELGRKIPIEEVQEKILKHFTTLFEVDTLNTSFM